MSESAGAIPNEPVDAALLRARIKGRLLGSAPKVCLGRFELRRRLGGGGEGTVYEARDQQGGGVVALKQLHPEHVASGASLKREFRALADLVHPNLVVLHELFHEQNQWFFTMELVAGVDFLTYVRAASPDAEARLCNVLLQLFAGLAALHGAGKMHRDLKPSNVLVRADGSLVIVDYGLVVEQGAAPGDRAGTPAYAAPEQADGRVEPASDLYAVGVMLFHALTGRLPFEGTPAEVIAQKEREPAPHVEDVAADVPADLAALCARLLARAPADRPTAREALAACGDGVCAPDRSRAASPPIRSAPTECFVGRHDLLAELVHLSTARAHGPVFVLLDGQSGIGKSALVQRFCAQRAEAGALVLDGRCYERESLPYKALDAIVEGLISTLNARADGVTRALPLEQRSALVRLFPAFARLHGPQPPRATGEATDAIALRERAFSALKQLFSAIAAEREVVFAVDDLQWGDLDSIALLDALIGTQDADGPRILLLGVYRSEERETSPAMQAILSGDVLRGPHLVRIERTVGPLARDDAAALLHALARPHGGALSATQLETCLAQAGGLPFALHQFAEHLHDVERAASDRDASLGELVRLRARRCSPAARTLLEVLCVAGRPLETSVALRTSFADPVGWPAAAELCVRKLARWRDAEHERCLEPYHGLVQKAVARATPEARAQQIHRDIVDALAALGRDEPEHLVEHLLFAGESTRAGEMALVAAERAGAQLAWNRAADLFALAARTLAAEQVQGERVRERLAEALASADRYRDAAAAFVDAAQHAHDRGARQQLESMAAQQLMRAGDSSAGVALLERLLREVGYAYPRREFAAEAAFLFNRLRQRVDTLCSRPPAPRPVRSAESQRRIQVLAAAHNELWVSDPLRGSVIHTWVYREARRCSDYRWVRAMAWEIVQLSVRYGPRGEARIAKQLDALEALVLDDEQAFDRALKYLARAVYLLYCRWAPREGLRHLQAAEELFMHRCAGTRFERSWTALMTDMACELSGEFELLRTGTMARERGRGSADDSETSRQLMVSVPIARLLDDRPHEALEYALKRWRPAKTFTLLDYGVTIRVSSSLLYAGDAEAAHAYLCDLWWTLRMSGLFSTQVYDNAAYHRARNAVALYWETRDRRAKREVLRYTAGFAHHPPVMRGLFALLRASLARADGDTARCRRLLAQARDACMAQGGDAGAWCARYRLAQLDGSAVALAEAAGWFSARGVKHPERWVAQSVPGPPGFK